MIKVLVFSTFLVSFTIILSEFFLYIKHYFFRNADLETIVFLSQAYAAFLLSCKIMNSVSKLIYPV